MKSENEVKTEKTCERIKGEIGADSMSLWLRKAKKITNDVAKPHHIIIYV